ncbi:uncharacterized protein LOC108674169 [Hyalella azteca]|uniref:Uncharacterized protein LOC108674169 n=1 Tax=Hyalella azteca TaxID=294128 RepID=A0A8B7NUX5_HYAAZ|nr:uncharacterized protein LOC108674169 [Hyalella azteca]XP_018017569.1 uncharacterized protein LOC108674169 [Hyalella azteca]
MMKSVGFVLLLIATFAYSSVENTIGCKEAIVTMLKNADLKTAQLTCKADPLGLAALTALKGNPDCKDYHLTNGKRQCEVLAAPFMKCVAGKLGYLRANGTIANNLILALYKASATSRPACDVSRFNFGVKKCGTEIDNYAFLKKAVCIGETADHAQPSGMNSVPGCRFCPGQ